MCLEIAGCNTYPISSKCFQNASIYFFPEKIKINKKNLCLPYLKFSDPELETNLFFIWPKQVIVYQWLNKDILRDCLPSSLLEHLHLPVLYLVTCNSI